jgi:hypothetical protein
VPFKNNALSMVLAVVVSASMLVYMYKQTGFDVWPAEVKDPSVYCMVKFIKGLNGQATCRILVIVRIHVSPVDILCKCPINNVVHCI